MKQPWFAPALMLLGLLAIGLSYWFAASGSNASWTEEKANRKSEVNATLHETAHAAIHNEGTSPELKKRHDEAVAERNKLQEELDTAKSGNQKLAKFAYWAGLLLVLSGVVAHFSVGQRQNS